MKTGSTDTPNKLNNIEIVRLKDKLGTRQLPTAELVLKGSVAQLIGKEGEGVKMISKMLTVTRIYNASSAIAGIGRVLQLARSYAEQRLVGEVKLAKLPLQKKVFADLEVMHRGNLTFYLKIAELFSKEQAKTANHHEANLLRILTPILKLFTAKEANAALSEGVECFGGLGYIESSYMPQLLRDGQVLSIWEGTTNVLCYDFLRALLKQENPIDPFQSFIENSV